MPVTVKRYAGDKVGNPIIEPLLSDSVLFERGRFELDNNGQQKVDVTADISYRGGLVLGQLMAISDPTNSTAYKAKVTGISIDIRNGSIKQTLKLERQVYQS